MTEEEKAEIIPVGNIEDVNKHVMKVIQTQVKAEQDLRGMALFEDQVNNVGAVMRKKSQRNTKTSAMNQVLLEHRNQFDNAIKVSEKFNDALDTYMETDDPDGKTMGMMMVQISKAEQVKTRELENMGKNITSQTVELNKGSIAMQKTISDIVHMREKTKQHSDKMDIAWALLEKRTGKSREDLMKELNELYGDE